MPTMYPSPDAASEYRHMHGKPRSGAYRDSTKTQGGHVNQDGPQNDGRSIVHVPSPVNERVRSTDITNAAPTPNQRAKKAQFSQDHQTGAKPGNG